MRGGKETDMCVCVGGRMPQAHSSAGREDVPGMFMTCVCVCVCVLRCRRRFFSEKMRAT